MDSFKKFNETELPSKSEFFSSLKNEDISEKDYKKAKNIWNDFEIKTLNEYYDLYLKTDVSLLADVFEKIIKTLIIMSLKSLNYYGMDPCHYFSSPGLPWDSMLKMTKVELELINDIDIHLFIEERIRGGISYIAKRHSKSNNKYMKNYDNTMEDIFIMYLDENNLYEWAMTQYLTCSDFKWMSENSINKFNIDLVKENSQYGYTLEVDLEYPNKLHDHHNDYPLAPEKLKINNSMLSKYCSDIANNYGIKVGEVNKLVLNLGTKKFMLFIT